MGLWTRFFSSKDGHGGQRGGPETEERHATFRPVKEHTSARRVAMSSRHQATLGSGNLIEAINVPPGEDLNEWLVSYLFFFWGVGSWEWFDAVDVVSWCCWYCWSRFNTVDVVWLLLILLMSLILFAVLLLLSYYFPFRLCVCVCFYLALILPTVTHSVITIGHHSPILNC